jgi:MFS family permease
MAFTLSSLLIRFLAGKISDKYGRVKILKVALIILMISLILIGLADSAFGLLTAAAIYGIATGILSPTTSAWTVDLSHPERRGKAMATMYIALEAGIGIGALGAGWLFKDVIKMIPIIFYLSAGVALTGLIYLLFRKQRKELEIKINV